MCVQGFIVVPNGTSFGKQWKQTGFEFNYDILKVKNNNKQYYNKNRMIKTLNNWKTKTGKKVSNTMNLINANIKV